MPRRSVLRVVCVLGALAGCSLPAAGQTNPVEQPLLGSVWTLDQLRDLPTSNNPLALVESVQPEAIADRFTAGGLNAATPPRFGGFLGSWTQTEFRVGDVSVTDPRTGGTPLLLPILPFWDRLTIATGAMGPEENASALSMTLDPRRPGSSWSREFEGWGSGSGLVAGVGGPVPAVDQLDRWQDWSAVVSGPLTPQLGLAAGGAWRRLVHVQAPGADTSTDSVASGLVHLLYSASPRDEVRFLGYVQRVAAGSLTDTGVHAQSAWEHRDPQTSVWRVFGGYTGTSRTAPGSTTVTVDSLTSDPVSNLFDSGGGTARRWTAGARLAPQASQVSTIIGVDVGGADTSQMPSGISQIRELVDGLPARIWSLHEAAASDSRHLRTISAFGNEHLTISGVTIDGGLRLEHVSAAADAAADGVSWTNWLPSAAVRWQVVQSQGVALSASYRRTAYQLPLNLLAIGDPAATVADVSSWNGSTTGPAIARVGPGTGGDATFSRLDPDLQRPTTDELVLAVEWQPTRTWHFELARITKREQPLIVLTDPGVPASLYSTVQVPDPSFLPFNQLGSPFVTVYNRPPNAYGSDRYLLTNRPDDSARFWAVQFTVRASAERFTVLWRAPA